MQNKTPCRRSVWANSIPAPVRQPWLEPAGLGPLIDSINPSTGQRLAQVRGATAEDYERVMTAAVAAAAACGKYRHPSAARRCVDGRGTAAA